MEKRIISSPQINITNELLLRQSKLSEYFHSNILDEDSDDANLDQSQKSQPSVNQDDNQVKFCFSTEILKWKSTEWNDIKVEKWLNILPTTRDFQEEEIFSHISNSQAIIDPRELVKKMQQNNEIATCLNRQELFNALLISARYLLQIAAQNFVVLLSQQKVIINIDESSLQTYQSKQKAWGVRGRKIFKNCRVILDSVNIIAAVSSTGQLYFTVNKGRNNSFTVVNFISKLCQMMDAETPGWRENSILLVDNATYHRSKACLSSYNSLKIPLMFRGPYQFDLAPVEKIFAFIKKTQIKGQQDRAIKRLILFFDSQQSLIEIRCSFDSRKLEVQYLSSIFRGSLRVLVQQWPIQLSISYFKTFDWTIYKQSTIAIHWIDKF